MANKIQIRRGLKTALPTLDAGEPGFATDTGELYVGDGVGNVLINLDLPMLWGDGTDGAEAGSDADINNATNITTDGAVSLTHNRIWRANGTLATSHALTVGKQDGQARNGFPDTHGGPGVGLGAILATLASKGIPSPMRPGGTNTGLVGGIFQAISKGALTIGANITAQGTNSSGIGGGGGGLIVVVSDTSITISSGVTLDASGGAGHATAAAKGGGGGYSGEPGGHAGVGGSGGGGASNWGLGGIAGTGIMSGHAGGNADAGRGGGGSLDNSGGVGRPGPSGGNGGNNNFNNIINALKNMAYGLTAAGPGVDCTPGSAGTNGGGGGGGNYGGVGGDCGSGGGGGHYYGGNGAGGNANLFILSSLSIYAGRPGGQGGGGGGASYVSATNAGGAGAAGQTGSNGAGSGGAGGAGGAGQSNGDSKKGGAGGAGGNGGGAAGLILLIAPTVTVTGATLTGRVVIITGADCIDFLRGFEVD